MTKVGLIGAGRMGEALIRGFLQAGVIGREAIGLWEADAARLKEVQAAHGVAPRSSGADLIRWADVVLLAVKPQSVSALFEEVADVPRDGKLLVSIVAGLAVADLENFWRPGGGVVRVMPNTPAQVGAGVSMVCPGPGVDRERQAFVVKLFESVGKVLLTDDEKKMNVATALLGSGPAFVFLVIEALADGAVRMGMPRDQALTAAAQMVLGSARLVLEAGRHPAELKDQVTSPGGTTAEGLRVLEAGGVRGLLIDAIEAATRRSEELGRKKAKS